MLTNSCVINAYKIEHNTENRREMYLYKIQSNKGRPLVKKEETSIVLPFRLKENVPHVKVPHFFLIGSCFLKNPFFSSESIRSLVITYHQ